MNNDGKHLRLVKADKARTGSKPHNWKANRKALAGIELALKQTAHGGLGPRGNVALFSGFAIASVVMGIDRLITHLGFKVDGGIAPMIAISLFAISIACVQLFSSIPRSYYEKLDKLLTEYSPISIESYRKLQEDVEEFGMLRDIIFDWLDKEHHALALAAGWPIKTKHSFVNRKI